EGVDALADRGDGQLRVVEVRDRGDHGVDVAGVEHRDVVLVEGDSGMLFGGEGLLLGIDVADGAEGHALDPAVGDEPCVGGAVGAETDDAEADVLLRHGVSCLWWMRSSGGEGPRRAGAGQGCAVSSCAAFSVATLVSTRFLDKGYQRARNSAEMPSRMAGARVVRVQMPSRTDCGWTTPSPALDWYPIHPSAQPDRPPAAA